jgi:hypothetical protein
MPRNAKSFADEIDELWGRADAEGRDLTAAERIHVSELVVQAKSQRDIEEQIREIGHAIGPSFVTPTDPNSSQTGGGPGDVFIGSKGYQAIADPSARPQTWSTGPIEVAKGLHTLVKGTMLETTGGAAQVADWSRRSTRRGSWTSCSSRSAWRTFRPVDGERLAGPLRGRGHRDQRRRGCG